MNSGRLFFNYKESNFVIYQFYDEYLKKIITVYLHNYSNCNTHTKITIHLHKISFGKIKFPKLTSTRIDFIFKDIDKFKY